MASHSLLHSSPAGLSPRWRKEKKTWGSQWRKDLPNKIPLHLKAALGDPRIAHVLLVATFSSQGRVENSMILPWLGLASGIVLLGLPTGTYVTWVSGWSMALYIFYKTGDFFLWFWRTSPEWILYPPQFCVSLHTERWNEASYFLLPSGLTLYPTQPLSFYICCIINLLCLGLK